MTAVAGLLIWWSICFTYLRFYGAAKVQGVDRAALPYRAPFQPYLTYYAIVMISLVLFFSKFAVFVNGHWDTADFVTSVCLRLFFTSSRRF
jgi:amino acid transporter